MLIAKDIVSNVIAESVRIFTVSFKISGIQTIVEFDKLFIEWPEITLQLP